jgi:cyclopropane fatty-acyl-phospholipid synthase-like methyltransferase
VSEPNQKRQLDLLQHEQFPRSSNYSQELIIASDMGPNVLWLTEYLCDVMELKAGMRVLDLGCGKALSSIFLAREYGVQVWATDLWIEATENAERIKAEGLEHAIFPINADARKLPYAEGFFDAIVSIDAFEYFGTDGAYLTSLIKHVKPGHRVGIVNAGLLQEIDALPTEWPADFCTFHTPQWWRRHWAISRCVEVEVAEQMPNGRELWMRWNDATGATDDVYLRSEAGKNLGFHRVVGRRIG